MNLEKRIELEKLISNITNNYKVISDTINVKKKSLDIKLRDNKGLPITFHANHNIL